MFSHYEPPLRRCLRRIVIGALAAVLLVSGVLKVVTPDPSSVMAVGGSVAIGCVEMILAALLWTRYCTWGLWLSIALAMCGVLATWIVPNCPCGCLGRHITLQAHEHRLLAASVGMLACVAIWTICMRAKEFSSDVSLGQGPRP